MTYQEIANTILRQLGGNKFMAMTGAKAFLSHPPEKRGDHGSLSFQLPSRSAKDGINYVKITLTGADLYDMTFTAIGPRPGLKRMMAGAQQKVTVVKSLNGVFCDQLQDLFTDATGLHTRLF